MGLRGYRELREVEGSGGEGRGRGVKRDGRARMPKRKGQ